MDKIKWRCVVCGYVQEGQRPPSHCPICGVPAGMFEPMEDEKPQKVETPKKATKQKRKPK